MIIEIVPVPVGTPSPEQWEQYQTVKGLVMQQLPGSANVPDYAQAAVFVGNEVFSGQADVLVSLGRTINKTDMTLRCTSGSWGYLSTASTTVNDTSNWLLVADHLNVTGAESVDALTASLGNLLNTLNGQPGAQNAPDQAQQ